VFFIFGTGFVLSEPDYLPIGCVSEEDKKCAGMHHNTSATTATKRCQHDRFQKAVFHLLSNIPSKEKHFLNHLHSRKMAQALSSWALVIYLLL